MLSQVKVMRKSLSNYKLLRPQSSNMQRSPSTHLLLNKVKTTYVYNNNNDMSTTH